MTHDYVKTATFVRDKQQDYFGTAFGFSNETDQGVSARGAVWCLSSFNWNFC
jgi:hypothetical protein